MAKVSLDAVICGRVGVLLRPHVLLGLCKEMVGMSDHFRGAISQQSLTVLHQVLGNNTHLCQLAEAERKRRQETEEEQDKDKEKEEEKEEEEGRRGGGGRGGGGGEGGRGGGRYIEEVLLDHQEGI